MQEDNKFYYSELEDKIIVDSIQNDFKNRQILRKPFELIWELNMNFYLGNQYSYISNSQELLNIEKSFFWENRETYNHIAPIIESRLSKLSKIKPKFSVKPNSNNEVDLYATKLSGTILSNCLNQNHFEEIVSTATHWSEITGTSFYKITWDNNAGNFVGVVDNKNINGGDVKISVCSPFEIYPDSNETSNLQDCLSIIYAKALPVRLINETYNTSIDGDDVDTLEIDNQSYLSNISGRTNTSKITHSTKTGYAYLIERYEKPTTEYPNGRLTIICKDTLLFDGDLPYKTPSSQPFYPFVKQVSNKKLSSFWGSSVIERCIPIQRAYNALKNKKHEYISRLASGILTVEDGSVDVDNLEDEGLAPGKILIYRSGSTPPKFMSPGTIPAELEKEEESLLNELNSLSGISDITTSSTIPTNISSGSAISLLIEQDESRLSLTADYIRASLVLIAQQVLSLFKQYATTPRITKQTTPAGEIELFYWTNQDLVESTIKLEQDNELQRSSNDKKDLILTLYEKGLFNNSDGYISSSTKTKIFNALDVEEFETKKDINEVHAERAIQENLNPEIIEQPLEIDNHKLHIEEHTRFLLTEQNISKETKNKILTHIKQHKKYLEI